MGKIYNAFIKRLLDLIVALVFVVIISPVLLIISIWIKIDSKGPVFYRGVRSGRHGREFRIFKFRSMVAGAENLGGGTTALNDSRITRAGSFLRKSKLDEIPQLFNIVLGDMSFIGPRPELTVYTRQYSGNENIILDVRPGITDLSSLEFISLDEIVGGENADEAYEKYVLSRKNKLRVEYALKQSFALDVKLFFETVFYVAHKIVNAIVGRKSAGKYRQYGIQNTSEF